MQVLEDHVKVMNHLSRVNTCSSEKSGSLRSSTLVI